MNLLESLRRAQTLGLERIDAQLLHLLALGRPLHERAWLLAHDTDTLDEATLARLEPLLQRRLAGEPLAYITGTKEFFGLPLQVDARVLDPRPDTETLVEWALELLPTDTRQRVADLGTGSGAIALAVQPLFPASLGIRAAAAQAADPQEQVYFVPAFVGLGAPWWDAQARGSFSTSDPLLFPQDIDMQTNDKVAIVTNVRFTHRDDQGGDRTWSAAQIRTRTQDKSMESDQ